MSSVTGDWDQTTAQKAVATVLPSLPAIIGVVEDVRNDGLDVPPPPRVATPTAQPR